MAESTTHQWILTNLGEKRRLDAVLAVLSGKTREYCQQLITQGCVQVNQIAITKHSHHVAEDDTLTLQLPALVPLQLVHTAMALDVEFEDEHLLVLNKPPGLLTHPTGRQQPDTLVNALLAHCAGQLSGIQGVERPGIVHRLDRETSGLMVVAKTDAAHQHLSQQLQQRTMSRQYWALVQGDMPAKQGKSSGSIRQGLGRHASRRNSMQISPRGRMACTHWQVKQVFGAGHVPAATWVELTLETGRTHQIRVHLTHIGHPLFGDVLYGTGVHATHSVLASQPCFGQGQLLQAFRLQFIHPATQQPCVFERKPDARFAQALQLFSSPLS